MNIRYRVELHQSERDELRALLAGGRQPARRLKRAQILLAADQGATDAEIAGRVVCGLSTVTRTKRRFVEGNLELSLSEAPRAGAARKLTGREEALPIATACSKPPPGRARWTLELLCDANRHILPALGTLPLAVVERRHVMALHESLCETPAMANMVVATLSHMYVLAGDWEMLAEDCDNPCQAIPKNPERKRERFLTEAEFARLGQVLGEVSGNGSRISAGAVTAIRLLMLTGCRKNEIMTLPWEHVDLDRAEMRIVDGKRGSRTVHLSPSAVDVLAALPRLPGNPWVVPGARPGTHMTDIDGAWRSIRARAGLDDVRIHDIRHSFASRALALGEGLPIIGQLLGHRRAETTARYAHLDRDTIGKSAERIAVRIAAYL